MVTSKLDCGVSVNFFCCGEVIGEDQTGILPRDRWLGKMGHTSRRRNNLMGRVVALMDDIFFQMKVAETAKHLGIEFKVATTVDALMTMLDPPTQLVIVDLNARSKPVEAIVKLRAAAKDMRVVAFLSHVQKELAQQAKDAGCDEVMPRSSFTQNLAEILSPAKA
jgi:ActR/RegA family two-component response regulator